MALLQEDLIDVMPAVEEANSISEELDNSLQSVTNVFVYNGY